MADVSDISSVSWTDESFEIQSSTSSGSSVTDNKIKEKSPTFNKRNKIIFTISAIIILIIIIIITITVSLVYIHKTSTQTSFSINDNQTESTITTAATIYDVGNGGASGDPPCLSYTVINDPTRNVNAPGVGGTCDDGPLFNTSIGGRWIRFVGAGGTAMAITPPGREHCGAFLAVWYNGTLPLTSETIVNGNGCFETYAGECILQVLISVVKCDNFWITVNASGLTIRSLMPSYACRSSPYQFCCNQDLCNSLSSPPLPAFTTLTCAIDVCYTNDSHCNDSIVYLSSATESCTRKHQGIVSKSYQTGCTPNSTTMISSTGESISHDLFCCNYPECNQQILPRGEAIHCYTCDSRITRLRDCNILNPMSKYVYNSASSNPSESCAMIVGLAGKDFITGQKYPAFTIRTFINNCTNQSFGNVTYGGVTFEGRIDCCSTSLCNKSPLYTTLQSLKSKHINPTIKMIVVILVICLGFIFITMGILLSVYRFRMSKPDNRYIPNVLSDGVTVLFLPRR
ncbi:unnamed protein product [Adineta steineri]|uniref:Uncharacterized protein n=1 Tax=Adineta steineri TaxID=433720 RepID=A0A816DH57_9BILA|nr:unnamed protein product [Adineta steineri]CAF1635917.1 unnamed protein product [Adineta steineri]